MCCIICDFCGYLAQVKASVKSDINVLPVSILGAAWSAQKERMDAGIYFPLFFVIFDKNNENNVAVYYLSADLQSKEMFRPRKPLADTAKRAGWQGFTYDLTKVIEGSFVRLV
jgi:type II restriction enzyme